MTSPQEPRSGGQILVDQLKIHGVDLAFCVPGESYLAVLDGLYEARNTIRLITCRQEGGAAMMADCEGRLTGKPGICFVTRGPGATNASAGVHIAMQDSSPMILFIGQIAGHTREREAFQEVNYKRFYGDLAKWVVEIDRAERIPELVGRAFSVATSGRPGPVVVALPEDMLMSEAEAPAARVLTFHAAGEWLVGSFPAAFADAASFAHSSEAITPRIRRLADALAIEALNDRFLAAERLEFMLQELVLSIIDTYLARRRAASALWRGSRFEDSRIRRAISLLRARLKEAEQQRQTAQQAQERRLQVGSGDRSERIRTYNYPQARVTDHRINQTLHQLPAIMDGALEELIVPLQQEWQAAQLAALD